MRTALLLLVLIAANAATSTPKADPPDACKMLTLEDVTAVLGQGFSAGTAGQASAGSTCTYQKDRLNFVTISITPAKGGDAKAVLFKRRDDFERHNKGVLEVPAVCSDAFVVATSATSALMLTAKGEFNTELQVVVDGRADTASSQKLARTVCGRLP